VRRLYCLRLFRNVVCLLLGATGAAASARSS